MVGHRLLPEGLLQHGKDMLVLLLRVCKAASESEHASPQSGCNKDTSTTMDGNSVCAGSGAAQVAVFFGVPVSKFPAGAAAVTVRVVQPPAAWEFMNVAGGRC